VVRFLVVKKANTGERRFRLIGIARTYVSDFFEQRYRLQAEIEINDNGDILQTRMTSKIV
jgi:hypothetical protein